MVKRRNPKKTYLSVARGFDGQWWITAQSGRVVKIIKGPFATRQEAVDRLTRQRRLSFNSPNQFVEDAKERIRRGDSRGAEWVFYQIMTPADKKAFDKWIVDSKDPLGYEPGTTWDRFKAKVRQNPITRKKARTILRHGKVRGHQLTAKQQRFFGARASGYPVRRINPPRGTLIYGRVLKIFAQKTSGPFAGQRFVHTFKKGAIMVGMPDGSLRISHP